MNPIGRTKGKAKLHIKHKNWTTLWGEFAIALVRKAPLRIGRLLRLSISGNVGEEVRAGLICFINRLGISPNPFQVDSFASKLYFHT